MRHLGAFNQTLLARAGWRICLQLESLCARLLRDKYFPDSEFFTATLDKKPSYLWRTLLWGRELLAKGLSWKVGNERNIDIWPNNWIPAITHFKPFINRQSAFPELKVSNFISERDKCWDLDCLALVLHPIDIRRVQQFLFLRRLVQIAFLDVG